MSNREKLIAPNFFVAGVAKSGTTLMYEYLRQHPEIYMSQLKEPRYFQYANQLIDPQDPVNVNTKTEWGDYLSLFQDAGTAKAIGECSDYFSTGSMALISEKVPDAKFIVILRDPVERAYSHFLFSKLNGYEPSSATFSEAIRVPEVKLQSGWIRHRRYIEIGLYGSHLTKFLNSFDRNRIKLFLFEEFVKDPLKTMQKVYEFLGLSQFDNTIVEIQKAKSGRPRSYWFFNLIKKLAPHMKHLINQRSRNYLRDKQEKILNSLLSKKPMKEDDREHLLSIYSKDYQLLTSLVELDFKHWKSFEDVKKS